MKTQFSRWPIAIALITLSMTATAGNRTFTGTFTGEEPSMTSTTGSCDPGQQSLPYQVVGDLQVSQTGEYRLLEIGVDDMTHLLYDGPFDPNSPETNLIAAIDVRTFNEVDGEETITLDSDRTYTFVVQQWCSFVPDRAVWGGIMDGPGDISGAGFESNPDSFGNFAGVSDQASFPFVQSGNRKYVATSFQPERSGNHLFLDVSDPFGGELAHMLIYDGPFDPNDTSANLLENLGHGFLIQLDQDTAYTLVVIDEFSNNTIWQLAIYGPGIPGMQTHISGGWFSQATNGQGIMLDYGPNTRVAPSTEDGYLFLTWFTFNDAATPSKTTATEAVGTNDQRWLSATAIEAPPGSTEISLQFYSSSGGVFDESPADPPDPYGTGTLTVNGCNEIVIDYDLESGNSGSMQLQRILGRNEVPTCYEQAGLGELRR